jgi:hypothetical protein
MTSVMSPKPLKTLLCAWLLACMVATVVNTDVVFGFAYFVLPASALVVPVLVAALAVQVLRARASPKPLVAPRSSVAAELTSYALLPIAYLMSFAVLARLLEIPWRRAKFGGESLDLGLPAAAVFSLAAVSVAGIALVSLRRLQPRSRGWAAATASIAMLLFASLLYLAVGVSPLVQWRA